MKPTLTRQRTMPALAVYPKLDKPYLFGLHQCRFPRAWTSREQRFFQEIGRRIEDALSMLLMFRRLEKSEAKLEEAQRITHVGYWDRDLDSDIISWSNETYRIFGRERQEGGFHLSKLAELIHPEDRMIMIEAVAEAIRGGQPYNVEYRAIRPVCFDLLILCAKRAGFHDSQQLGLRRRQKFVRPKFCTDARGIHFLHKSLMGGHKQRKIKGWHVTCYIPRLEHRKLSSIRNHINHTKESQL